MIAILLTLGLAGIAPAAAQDGEVDMTNPAEVGFYGIYYLFMGTDAQLQSLWCTEAVEGGRVPEAGQGLGGKMRMDFAAVKADAEITGDMAVVTFSGTLTVTIELQAYDYKASEMFGSTVVYHQGEQWVYCDVVPGSGDAPAAEEGEGEDEESTVTEGEEAAPTEEEVLVDSDGDGFVDDEDACPSEPGTISGCPEPEEPVTLEPYESVDLGLKFDAPVGWTEWVNPDLNIPEIGLAGVHFYADEADVELVENLSGSMLLLMRVDEVKMGTGGQYSSPEEYLVNMVEIDSDQVATYEAANYPAAHLIVGRDTDTYDVEYALQLGTDDWLLIVLITNSYEEAVVLDEVLMQPLVASVEVLDTGTE